MSGCYLEQSEKFMNSL